MGSLFLLLHCSLPAVNPELSGLFGALKSRQGGSRAVPWAAEKPGLLGNSGIACSTHSRALMDILKRILGVVVSVLLFKTVFKWP